MVAFWDYAELELEPLRDGDVISLLSTPTVDATLLAIEEHLHTLQTIRLARHATRLHPEVDQWQVILHTYTLNFTPFVLCLRV